MITSGATGVDTQAWDYLKHYYDTQAIPAAERGDREQGRVRASSTRRRRRRSLDAAAAAEAARLGHQRGARTRATRRPWRPRASTVQQPTAKLTAELNAIGEHHGRGVGARPAGADGEAILNGLPRVSQARYARGRCDAPLRRLTPALLAGVFLVAHRRAVAGADRRARCSASPRIRSTTSPASAWRRPRFSDSPTPTAATSTSAWRWSSTASSGGTRRALEIAVPGGERVSDRLSSPGMRSTWSGPRYKINDVSQGLVSVPLWMPQRGMALGLAIMLRRAARRSHRRARAAARRPTASPSEERRQRAMLGER